MDSIGGHTTNALLKSLIHVVNTYEHCVGKTPNLFAKPSFDNPSIKRINVRKHSSR